MLPACEVEQRNSDPVFHPSHEPSKQGAPYSDIVETEDFYFLSGQIGQSYETRELAPGGIEAEARQAIENIQAVLEHHNSSLDRVVKATVFLSNINDYTAFNGVYSQYFTNKPARTTVAAAAIPKGAKVEIEVIVAK